MSEEVMLSGISEISVTDNIAVLTIANGPKNLLTEPEFIKKDDLNAFLATHKNLIGLIITGKGRHFSHGADVSLFSDDTATGVLSERLNNAKELLDTIENLPILTAAAINGGCFGGGLETALSCQFRICSKKAFLGLPEVMHGVIPGMGGIERLTRLLGKRKAIELILSGKMFTADEAFSLGIADKVCDTKNCLDETIAFVKCMAEGKSLPQINAIIETVNNTVNGIKNPSGNKFEEVLSKRNEAM